MTNLASDTRKTLGATYCVSESGTAGPTGGSTRNRTPGYVALAVVKSVGAEGGKAGGVEGKEKEVRVWTRECETGSAERESNMIAFAVEGLKLVAEVVEGMAGEGEVVKEREAEEEGGARM